MCVGRNAHYNKDADFVFGDVLSHWLKQMIFIGGVGMNQQRSFGHRQTKHFPPKPSDVAFISCFDCSCVIGKDALKGFRHKSAGGTGCT
jgi:CRISPR/Cas system CMR-associated protein Cmr1 (group 7 of RAMP superfamily)